LSSTLFEAMSIFETFGISGFHAEISGLTFLQEKKTRVLKIDVRKLWGHLELMSLVTLVPSE